MEQRGSEASETPPAGGGGAGPGGGGGGRGSSEATARLVFGLFIIALGVLFTLDRIDLLDAGDYLVYWPVVFITFGLIKLAQARTAGRGIGPGLVWIAAGLLLLAFTLDYLRFSLFDLWPLVLVLFGWRLVARARHQAGAGGEGAEPELSATAVMGGLKRSSRSTAFRGGDLTAVMGGCEIDLRQAELAGEEAVIDVFAFWGGIEIVVPEGWEVENEVVPILGTFEDKTVRPPQPPAGRLVVKGFAVMGGVEVVH